MQMFQPIEDDNLVWFFWKQAAKLGTSSATHAAYHCALHGLRNDKAQPVATSMLVGFFVGGDPLLPGRSNGPDVATAAEGFNFATMTTVPKGKLLQAHCLMFGLGTSKDLGRAAALLEELYRVGWPPGEKVHEPQGCCEQFCGCCCPVPPIPYQDPDLVYLFAECLLKLGNVIGALRLLDELLAFPVGESLASYVQACIVKACVQWVGWGIPRDPNGAYQTLLKSHVPFADMAQEPSMLLVRRVGGIQTQTRVSKVELVLQIPEFLRQEVTELESVVALDQVAGANVAVPAITSCCVLC